MWPYRYLTALLKISLQYLFQITISKTGLFYNIRCWVDLVPHDWTIVSIECYVLLRISAPSRMCWANTYKQVPISVARHVILRKLWFSHYESNPPNNGCVKTNHQTVGSLWSWKNTAKSLWRAVQHNMWQSMGNGPSSRKCNCITGFAHIMKPQAGHVFTRAGWSCI